MDRFEAMSVFMAVTEAGSLSAAGRRLGMPLATVSRKVSELEAHLRTRLLTRSNRQLALTDAGRSYLAACKRILEELGEAERIAAGEYSAPRGELLVTAPIVFGRLHVLPVMAEFLKAYPEIDIRLVLADRVVHLLEEHIDLAVRIGDLPDSSMVATRVGAVRRVVCASPAYLAARGVPKQPGELAGHDVVSFEGLTSASAWSFGAGKAEVAVPVHSRLVVNTAEAAIDAAIAGVGLTSVLSYQAAEAVRAGRLDILLEAFEPPPWPVSLVYASRGLLPLKLRAFLDFAVPRLKERLA
ncbi:LysR family transcriptional regulator [Bosea caraganae]|uniref:LysR family transcriptional regulator n=1 Tax=Bosea caraganae TaxID=2763117 RepID=A0A370L9Y7_9HYPH|nr:LysR family transcriptional regulator [Bosea caraganae]RDJ21824.1 LysR family transcriptional regulator [Bosea caraganae]RDJ28145.1 LysR family transcriptional regulator [Bosea caraganae]